MYSEFIAHIDEKTQKTQTIREHSENTANLCESFSIPKLKRVVYAAGLLHDCGKWQLSFQKRIQNNMKIRVEHSACGAIVAKKSYPGALGLLMQYCIAGHHSGIPDGGNKNDTPDDMHTLYARLKRTFEDYSEYKKELTLPNVNVEEFMEFLMQDCDKNMAKVIDKFAFLTRYSFSCLVDADSIDTAEFCGNISDKKLHADFHECLNRVNQRLESFVCTTVLQKTRSLLQRQVFLKVKENKEIYLMNMPTGSGKTLCSIKFALERAIRANKKRIIYIIPYNSIIDQTADEFENLFRDCAELLRHQSTFIYDGREDYSEDYREAVRNASENWDAPIIITTAVQFFESIYSNKRRKLRKLHNMADSILIFDEAHLMPINYLQPCLQAITYITRYLNSETVFLTATMPDYEQLIKTYAMSNSEILNLVEDHSQFYKFQKCNFKYLEKMETDEILMRTLEFPSSLIVVNQRKTAKLLYQKVSGKKYHLSTYMTWLDRAYVLAEIKKDLKQLAEDYPDGRDVPENRRITVVSTSLIEAGVDLDMCAVFRELAGLDSILQAGGRCNREGKRKDATTFVFELSDGGGRLENERANVTRRLIRQYENIASDECIKEYYRCVYFLKQEEIQSHTLSANCPSIFSIPFKTYAEHFELIDSKTVSLIIPQDEVCRDILNRLEYMGIGKVRKLQQYACSLHLWEFNDLLKQHAVKECVNGIFYLANMDYYDKETGISFEAKDYVI